MGNYAQIGHCGLAMGNCPSFVENNCGGLMSILQWFCTWKLIKKAKVSIKVQKTKNSQGSDLAPFMEI
jgi:hypothetical protein